jgi:mRNA interferase MazF
VKPDIVIAAITSQTSVLEFGEFLIGDWRSAGLLRASALKPVYATVERTM